MTRADHRPVTTSTVPPAANGHVELRAVLGMFATGVTVVTSGRDLPHGMTANAFTSVSLDPAMVLVCVKRKSILHDTVLSQGAFAVSILSSGQEGLARYFASSSRPRDEREFATVPCQPGQHTGAPIVEGSLAWVECKLAAVYDGGDHSIFLGFILGTGRGDGSDALLFHGGRFCGVGSG
ncbi:flavin reductase family protein [Micromonospora sp. HNM0581]|uniref:flavin reductase family protein n=1 Tax=Micromonospora sp. HNM0581 TaxID=2716341 RepID=UPI00146DA5D7|nr:flavin reductase family protein [Micromonospora sp. HNM0581]NLU79174.1 flavin reductase family protein [Micromonospora sp. HNM0581]